MANQRMEVHLHQRLEQRMKLSQQMLQNLELLQMPIMDLREVVMQELQENPVLELKEETPDQDRGPAEERAEREAEAAEDRMEVLEAVEHDLMDIERRRPRGDREASERKQEFLQNVAARDVSLREYLREQISVRDISPELRRLAEHIVDAIDDDGYLRFELADLIQSLPDEIKTEPADILEKKLQSALAVVQQMDPPGVGARNTTECLLLQLTEENELHPLLRLLVEKHLDDISHNRLPKLAKMMAEDPETVRLLGYTGQPDPDQVMDDLKLLIKELSKLNLRPGANFAGDLVPRVHPEVTVREIDGNLEIVLEDSYLPPVSINRHYQNMSRDKKLPKEERDFLRRKMDAGRRLISAIEQRRGTIQRITQQILDRQGDFFEHGIEHLKPLKMQEVADTLGIHVSTVSRAISDKYVETPRGIFPLKFFFPSSAAPRRDSAPMPMTAAAQNNDADQQTRLVLKQAIREVIEAEDRKKPLSDLEIAKMLKDRGYNAARRTVAKYREELGIPSSRIRQEY